jgi:Tfp pilus assembly protein PilO
MNANRLWMIGGALAAVLIAIGAYLLGIQPQLQSAAAAADQQVQAQSQLQQTQVELAQLKKDYASMDQLTAQLATLRKSVPGTSAVSDFVRQLSTQASAANVSISSINVSEPTAYAPTKPAGAAPAATPAPTGTPSAGPSAASAAKPANGGQPTAAPNPTTPAVAPPLVSDPAITSANFVLLPVSLTATGDDAALLAFTHAVQDQGPRLFLVSKLDIKASGTGDAAAAAETATMSGFIYILVSNN